jgi:hypothetical protein
MTFQNRFEEIVDWLAIIEDTCFRRRIMYSEFDRTLDDSKTCYLYL